MTTLIGALLMSAVTSAPLTGAVEMYNNRPVLVIGGERMYPMIYALTEGGRRTWEEVPRSNLQAFADQGYRLFQIDVWFRDIWRADGSLDMDTVRRQVRGVLDVRPDAAVFIRLHVDAPGWWLEAHPDEWAQYATGPVEEAGDLGRGRRNSFASEPWRRDSTEQLRAFCKALSAAPEGDCIVGLHLAGGVYGEWHYWGFPEEPDTGQAMTQHFREWLRARYGTDEALQAAWRDDDATIAAASVPDLAERRHTDVGAFRNPQTERRVIDYYRCQQNLTADVVLHFCREAKANWPRPLITGAFYGYFFYMREQAAGGHMELARVLESPDIDYLSAPFSYEADARYLGGHGHVRALSESLALHGKLWLSEMDQPTHLGDTFRRVPPDLPVDLQESIATVRRNVAQSLFRGQGMWWYDFGPRGAGGWWNAPELLDEAGKLRRLAERLLYQPHRPVADVLLVYDPQAFYVLGPPLQDVEPISPMALNRLLATVHHSGVMADTILLSDLPHADLDRYRLVVFALTPVMTDEQRASIHERGLREGRTVLWIWAPGYTDGETLSRERLSQTAGMELVEAPTMEHPSIRVTGEGMPQVVFPRIETNPNLPPVNYGPLPPVTPLFAVVPGAAETMGVFEGTEAVALARKRLDDATVWYAALPPVHTELFRAIARDAGAHIYLDTGDVILATRDMLCVHTITGGDRAIAMPDGRVLELSLPPRSTRYLDAQTGEDLLE